MTSLRLSLATALLVLLASTAIAQPTNAQRADELNSQGKAAMKAKNFAEASDRFNQAILLSREGRFYYNLCVSLFFEGKLVDSLASCKAVETAGADNDLKDKTGAMIGKVKDEMRKQGYDPDAPPPTNNTNPDNTNPDNTNPDNTNPDNTNPNNTNPDNTNPNNTNPNNTVTAPPPTFRPPPTTLLDQGTPAHQYTWTLGAELLGGNANFGGNDVYTKAMYGFRVLGDYLIAPSKKIGVQAVIGVMHTDQNDSELTGGIDVVDIGIGGYKHLCGTGRFCFTPLLGASLGLMKPDVSGIGSDALLAIGIRAEGRLGYALGTRYEHLISLSVGFQGYTRAFDGSNFTAEDVGLDGFSPVIVVALGYTYRFNTPFGSSPFVTL